VASRLWTPSTWQHAGQLAWSSVFADPDSPAAVWDDAAFGWLEAADWLEIAVDPARATRVDDVVAWALAATSTRPVRTCVTEADTSLVQAFIRRGFAVEDGRFFVQLTQGLAGSIDIPTPAGYSFRSVTPGEAESRAACHRAAWSDVAPSALSGSRYAHLMRTAPYRHELDWVAVDDRGEMVASCLVWLDGGVALVEPVGCVPGHRGHGLAGAVTLAALQAAREYGAHTGLVRPRGDDGYPGPARLYRSLGFRPTTRTLTLVGPDSSTGPRIAP
jgi:predicted N-acetyltransferase YhbS